MSLPEIVLDDRKFQDLVSEARRQIIQKCPEWSEHNVSDPGITLIELFAWMTDMLVYRLNRVPDKLHVALLDLLGIRLEGPTAAETGLRFRLADPAQEPVPFPAGTEVGTVRTATDESIVFQTKTDFTILPLRPVAYVVERGGSAKDVGVASGVAVPDGADRLPFGTPPAVGDALYLGFAQPLDHLLMRVTVECSQARGAGVDPRDPPLQWEVSRRGRWSEATVLKDTTGGFNFKDGGDVIELELPRSSLAEIAGQHRHWLRCRIHDKTRSGKTTAAYVEPPEIYRITAAPIGALLAAAHDANPIGEEVVGESDGTPGQSFRLQNTPVLEPEAGETLEVRGPGALGWQRWERVDSLAGSGEHDRHFTLDAPTGEISFGPSVRRPDGRWQQYGAVPAAGSSLRFTRYRHGGGRRGNVGPNTLTVLKSAIPGVKAVTNPWAALGGVNTETLAAARQRAPMEIRTRYRAVTAEDFEFLAVEASPDVARALCIPPREGGPVRVHIVPRIDDAARRLTFDELTPSMTVRSKVASDLDKCRLLGAQVEVRRPALRGVSVVTEIQVSPLAEPRRVEADVATALYTYVNPLIGGPSGDGWGFGRLLNRGELYGVVQAVAGVAAVTILRIYETDLETDKRAAQPAENQILIEPHELMASGTHVVRVAPRPGSAP